METAKIAQQLVELSQAGKWEEALEELFHIDAVSIEPEGIQEPITQGRDKIVERDKLWSDQIQEVHDRTVSEPLVAGNYFTVTMSFDLTNKNGVRERSEEVCVYEVKEGKIVKQQFFYTI